MFSDDVRGKDVRGKVRSVLGKEKEREREREQL